MRRLSQTEFIILMALMFSSVGASIDSMLPALPAMAEVLSPGDPNKVQLVVSAFVIGLGLGIFFAGPASDRLGRKPVILAGFALYGAAALVATYAQSLEVLVAARVVQGIGAAAPRVVGLAMIRDLYAGRGMARITSIVMMVFMLVPATAPALGQQIMHAFGWRGIFASYVVFALIAGGWLALRQGETLAPAARRAFSLPVILNGTKEVLGNRQVVYSTAALCFSFSIIVSMLITVQPIFDITFGMPESFPLWFGACAIIAGTGTVLNATLVMRLGMRRLIVLALSAMIVLSLPVILIFWSGQTGPLAFWSFYLWLSAVIFSNGLTFGNLNALALEPMGHMAGLASSVVGAISTVVAGLMALPVGLLFDGTPRVTIGWAMIASACALWCARKTREDQPAFA